MSLIQKTIEWSKTRKAWESDALRRIYDHQLTNEDDKDILAMLKKANGFKVDDAPTPQLFSESHGVLPDGDAVSSKLLRISDLRNVNRLKRDAILSFLPDGLTIVYGDNATGKSGYGRVFRRACRARKAGEAILPNLAKGQKPGSITASATFVFEQVGSDKETEVNWTDGDSHDSLLSIAVFDKDCARAHISDKNEVDFTPYGADLLPELVKLFERLKIIIGGEIEKLPALPSAVVNLAENSIGSTIVSKLSKATKDDDLKSTIPLSQAEKVRSAKLALEKAERSKSDPVKLATALRKKAAQFEQFKSQLTILSTNLSSEALSNIDVHLKELSTAEEVTKVTYNEGFSKEPLRGVGTDTWRALYLAAQAFAETEAYPGREYNSTFNERCVLCQQELTTPATNRMRRFESFIKGEAAKKLSDAKQIIVNLRKSTSDSVVDLTESYASIIEEVASEKPELHAKLQSFTEVAAIRKGLFLAKVDQKDSEAVAELPDISSVMGFLSSRFAAIIVQATAAEKSELTPQQKLDEAELLNLESRQTLSENLGNLLTYVAGLRVRDKLEKCEQSLNTRALSIKQGELMEEAITNDLHVKLSDELSRLGVVSIKPVFRKHSQKGKVSHSIVLEGMPSDVDPALILSEGEGLVVAIAAFLAELQLAPRFHVVVLDDPVSSLDQYWRRLVAKRLVELSAERQVVIFTHDVVFLCELEFWANYLGLSGKMRRQVLKVLNDETGVIADIEELPIEMIASFKDIISKLKRRHAQAERLKRDHTEKSKEYIEYVAYTYGLLRDGWERAIENVLFCDVIRRYRPSIEPTRLKPFEITSEIISTIDNAMSAASVYKHSSGAPTSYPLPNELLGDIEKLEKFWKENDKIKDQAAKASKAEGHTGHPTS